jgi:formylglycine-generating enzyme required for sulfatase activity
VCDAAPDAQARSVQPISTNEAAHRKRMSNSKQLFFRRILLSDTRRRQAMRAAFLATLAAMQSVSAHAVTPAAKTQTPASKATAKRVTAPSRKSAPVAKASAVNAPVVKALAGFEQTISGTLVKFEMKPVPGGRLKMADPDTPGATREVQIKPFWMGKTEVTWDEFDIYVFRFDLTEEQKAAGVDATSRPSKPYGAPDRGFGHQGYPALAMTYNSAEGYCKWLSQKTGRKFRLPTEAEWEWVARAGGEPVPGNDKAMLDKVSWNWDNANDKTHTVGSKTANAWGLHDLVGNVAEWCVGMGADKLPVVRGGSFDDVANKIHSGLRASQTPAWNITDPQNPKSKWWLANAPFVGFRVVCDE